MYYLHGFLFPPIVHTLAELKMTGNCLKGSRPLLSFDPVSTFQMSLYYCKYMKCCDRYNTFIHFAVQKFDKEPHFALLKELFTQVCVRETCINSKYTVIDIKQ